MKSISRNDLRRHIESENRWWDSGGVPKFFTQLTPRLYLERLYVMVSRHEPNRAIVLMGPRRVGKTVLLHHVIQALIRDGVPAKKILYASADHPLLSDTTPEEMLKLFSEATGTDLSNDPYYFFLDEVQYLPEWERYLKFLVDRNPHAKFVVSGSAAAALRLKSMESGAGRFSDFLLPPVTYFEYLQLTGRLNDAMRDMEEMNRCFFDYINYGGYPEIALSSSEAMRSNPAQFIKSDIIDKVLLRDLPSLYGIRDTMELNRLFSMLAHNTGEELSLDGISKRSQVSKATIKNYIEYLEAAFLIRVVHRVDKSARHFQRAANFKVYLTNTSTRTALFGPVGPDSEDAGHLVETALCSQTFSVETGPLYYARWKQGEVDCVRLNQANRVDAATEVKWSDRVAEVPGELGGLISFCHEHGLGKALVTTRTIEIEAALHQGVTLEFIPAAKLCMEIGAAMEFEHDAAKRNGPFVA